MMYAIRSYYVLKLNIDKAESELGWAPRWGFEATLDRTTAWYRAHADGQDMRAFTARL